jgi:hypothetical protein
MIFFQGSVGVKVEIFLEGGLEGLCVNIYTRVRYSLEWLGPWWRWGFLHDNDPSPRLRIEQQEEKPIFLMEPPYDPAWTAALETRERTEPLRLTQLFPAMRYMLENSPARSHLHVIPLLCFDFTVCLLTAAELDQLQGNRWIYPFTSILLSYIFIVYFCLKHCIRSVWQYMHSERYTTDYRCESMTGPLSCFESTNSWFVARNHQK